MNNHYIIYSTASGDVLRVIVCSSDLIMNQEIKEGESVMNAGQSISAHMMKSPESLKIIQELVDEYRKGMK